MLFPFCKWDIVRLRNLLKVTQWSEKKKYNWTHVHWILNSILNHVDSYFKKKIKVYFYIPQQFSKIFPHQNYLWALIETYIFRPCAWPESEPVRILEHANNSMERNINLATICTLEWREETLNVGRPERKLVWWTSFKGMRS